MKNDAEIVESHPTSEVDIGCHVTICDAATDERRTLVVGSYQVLDQQHDDEVSYAAPLTKSLPGATVGEERKVTIGGKTTVLRVVAIE